MRRSWFWLEAVVADDERALLTRNGRFQRILAPGRHRFFDPGREYAIEVVKAHRSEFPYDRALLIAATHPEVAREYFEIQRADPHVAVIVYFDGVAKGILPPMSTRAYWKTTTRVEFTLVDTRATLRVEPRILDQIDVPRSTLVSDHEIGAHEIGLLFVDGELTERLPPGRHAFWKATRKIAVQKFDLRPQPVEVTAQELLTKDRIGLRVTLTAFYRIVDPEKAMRGATDLQTALYRLIQFAVREAIADDIGAMLRHLQKPFQPDPAHKPHVVLVVGVNGSGKTTTIGKLAHRLHAEDPRRKIMLVAGDTFRAAAVSQLQIWGEIGRAHV